MIGSLEQPDGSLEELVELGTLAHAVHVDPCSDAGSQHAAGEVRRLCGRLDLLVNCLKLQPESSFENITEADLAGTLRRDLGSVQSLTKATLPLMAERPKPT